MCGFTTFRGPLRGLNILDSLDIRTLGATLVNSFRGFEAFLQFFPGEQRLFGRGVPDCFPDCSKIINSFNSFDHFRASGTYLQNCTFCSFLIFLLRMPLKQAVFLLNNLKKHR